MTAAILAALGAIVLAIGAWLRSALQRAAAERVRDSELEQIIVRAEQARDAIDQQTARDVAAVPTMTDAELEAEINK